MRARGSIGAVADVRGGTSSSAMLAVAVADVENEVEVTQVSDGEEVRGEARVGETESAESGVEARYSASVAVDCGSRGGARPLFWVRRLCFGGIVVFEFVEVLFVRPKVLGVGGSEGATRPNSLLMSAPGYSKRQ